MTGQVARELRRARWVLAIPCLAAASTLAAWYMAAARAAELIGGLDQPEFPGEQQ